MDDSKRDCYEKALGEYMSIEPRNNPSWSSLVCIANETDRHSRWAQEKCQTNETVALEGAVSGGWRGGLLGGTLALASSGPIGAAIILGTMGIGLIGFFGNSFKNDRNIEIADYIRRIRDIEEMGLRLIDAANQGINRNGLEDEFIEAIKNNHIVKGWTEGIFELNPEFDPISAFQPRFHMRLNLLFLNAIATIQERKRSVTSTCHAFQSAIISFENSIWAERELICFSRYSLGKCYIETRQLEKAREQFNKILCPQNGSINQSLKNDALRELGILFG